MMTPTVRSSWRIRGNVVVVLLLLLCSSIAPLNAQEEQESNYLRHRRTAAAVVSRPHQRMKPKRNRGGNRRRPNNNNATAALDKVRDNHRVKRGDSIRAQSPHAIGGGNTRHRPRDIPPNVLQVAAASNNNNNTATEPAAAQAPAADAASSEEEEQIPASPIRPARPHDMPNPFDNTKTLDDLIQDLFANEPVTTAQDQVLTEEEEPVNATEVLVPPTLNDRPIMTNETTDGGDIDFSNNDPIVFDNTTTTTNLDDTTDEEEDMDIQFSAAAAPAFKPNVCGANATEARATCASLPSCSRISDAANGTNTAIECYKECSMFDTAACGEGRRCVPFVGGCMGFASLPDDIDDNLFFTRITFDERSDGGN